MLHCVNASILNAVAVWPPRAVALLADATRTYWKGEIKQIALDPRLPRAPGV